MKKSNYDFTEDYERIKKIIEIKQLSNKTVFITGATGLVGSCIVKTIMYYNSVYDLNCKLILLVRNYEKAKSVFGDSTNIEYIESDIIHFIPSFLNIDYIIHAASQTNSKSMIEQPVETAIVSLDGTLKMLSLAHINKVTSMVYLSSMEVYGQNFIDEPINEVHIGNIDHLNIRSCYPESKRMCENLCIDYYVEYNVPVKIARLAQVFGPGIQKSDQRLVAQFMRNVSNDENIVIHSSGKSSRCYIYTSDCVSAILTLLLKGHNGQAYNCANASTYCSVYELATTVMKMCSNDHANVIVENQNPELYGFPKDSFLRLDSNKLNQLGWTALYTLEEMIMNTYKYVSGNN